MSGSAYAPPKAPTRRDARRNYDQILAAASIAVEAYGANASLEEIARRAGVGSATLHRHFSSRQHLLEAVFHDRVRQLVVQSRELAEQGTDPGEALVVWLRSVGAYVAATRGLAESLMRGLQHSEPDAPPLCYEMVFEAGDELVRRAHEAHALRPGVTVEDLLTIVYAFSLAAEQGTDCSAMVDGLLLIAIDGVIPERARRSESVERARQPEGTLDS